MKDMIQFKGGIRKARTCLVLLIISLMLFTTHAFAQGGSNENDPGDEFTLEEITVTGSRIRQTGMDTPTPVTVVVPDEIEMASPTTMIEGLAELPMFYGSNTTQNTGGFFETSGAGTLNLRGLQGKRTLTLLDGRRVVPSTIFGGPDINLFPELLLRSFETVTGGASAAYGTDAVAGVTNFILNTNYQGIKGHVQMGETARGDNKNYELAIGGGYELTDMTRILLSVEKGEQDPIYGDKLGDYSWYDSIGLVRSPRADAGTSRDNPFYIPVRKLYSQTSSIDGILTFPGSIGWYTFDSAGNAVPYIKSTGLCTSGLGTKCENPDGVFSSTDSAPWDNTTLTPESGRENYFAYIEHDISQKLKVYGQAMLGKSYFVNKNYGGVFAQYWGAFTVYRENPFLPQSIQDIMDANSLTSVKFSRNGGPEDIGFDPYTEQRTKTLSLTTGFEYTVGSGFFDDWQIKGYLQYGETDVKAIQRGGVRLDRIYLAMDVVTDPLTGQPACNVAVTTRGTANEMYQDCVPLNLFGAGQASAEAVDWVTGYEPGVQMDVEGFLSETESIPFSYKSSANKLRDIEIEQTVFEISADGELYEGWGAGPISMALGYHYRKAEFTQLVRVGPGGNVNIDPNYLPVLPSGSYPGIRGVAGGNVASGNIVDLQFSNVPFARGDENVSEVFSELLVPLLSDLPFLKQLNFNGAVRWADYSGVGSQTSAKAGLDYALNDELRFRSTLSRDVRAATMGEKFDRTGGIDAVTDYLAEDLFYEQNPNAPLGYTHSNNVTRFSNGSPDIKPEKATTGTVGMVYMPRWVEGLSFSMDWYSIEIKDNINQLNSAQTVEGCYVDGIQTYCNMIKARGGAVITGDNDGDPTTPEVTILDENGDPLTEITLVGRPYINKDSVKAVGIDFEIDYRGAVDWFGGDESIGFRLLGSYVGENSSTQDGVKVETADITYPEWTAQVAFNYQRGPFGLWFQNRYTGKTVRNRNWNDDGTTWDVSDNSRDAEIITDANVNYRFDLDRGNLNLYLNVENVFDRDPQPYYTGAASSFFGTGPGLGVVGDLRGRRFVVGLGFEFK